MKDTKAPRFTTTITTWPADPVSPGDQAGFILLRTAGPGPEVPDQTIHKSYSAALNALQAAFARRDEGGFTYGLYIAGVTILHVAADNGAPA